MLFTRVCLILHSFILRNYLTHFILPNTITNFKLTVYQPYSTKTATK